MGDTASLKNRLKSNKTSKVNRIVSLFEIPRPNKSRGLQRTNSLPASSRPVSSLDKDQEINTQAKMPHIKYNEVGRVKRIKEEIEQKSKSEQNNKSPTFIRKKRRNKRRNCQSECYIDDISDEDAKEIVQNLITISDRVGRIADVTEYIEKSDTELEIVLKNVDENYGNVFQNSEEHKEEIELRDKFPEVDSKTFVPKLSGDVIVNRLSNDRLINDQEINIDEVKARYEKYGGSSSIVSFLESTSSEGEVDDSHSEENDAEERKSRDTSDPESNDEDVSSLFWINNGYNDNEGSKQNHENDDHKTKIVLNETTENISDSEVNSIKWWKHKSFVQVNSNSPSKSNYDEFLPEDNEENTGENSESPTNTLEKRGRFIKNQVTRRSQRNNYRRAGVLLKSGLVKDLAQRFEGFKDAAEKGETEYYRRSFIDEMDKELENMKNDGFQDDFHLSLENLSILDFEEIDDDANCNSDIQTQKDVGSEILVNSDDETSSLSRAIMLLSNSQQNPNESANLHSFTDDDLFGETLFSEDLEHGLYYVESYNADGKELIMCSIQIDRQSVDLNKFDEVKSQSKSKLLAEQDDEKTLILMLGAESSKHRLSLDDSNNGTDSKRTTIYSTTSGDSFEDRLTDDEGIGIETSSSSYGYSAARRETYCDDQGIVRIERVAPYPKTIEEPPEYMNTTNYYYTINPKDEEEENYYESIRLEHAITACIPEVKKETLQYIVEEIKSTERKFVSDMSRVLYQYKPFLEERCPEKIPVVFGNMEDIYLKQNEFLETLEHSKDEIKEVVQAFIDFEDLFKLYPRYFKNTPKANVAVKELADLIKEKQELLNDKLHLSAYLLTPLQRLGKYKLFLENITKQLKKEDKSTGAVQMALEIIKKYMSKGNDAVAVGSILHSPLHYKDYGSFVTREKFTLIKPKRMDLMVFLFQEVIIFTNEDQRTMEQFIYWQSIKTEDLRIATFDDTTIHLTDYTKTKRRYTTKYTFVLDARTQKLKNSWKQLIEEILWKQLKKVKGLKEERRDLNILTASATSDSIHVSDEFLRLPFFYVENTLKEYQSGKKTPRKLGRNRIKSTGSSVFYVE